MLIGGNFSPFRAPAGGVPWFCGEHQHATRDDLREQYINVTVVPKRDGTGGNETAYERLHDRSGGISCDHDDHCAEHPEDCGFWMGTDQTAGRQQYTVLSAPQTFSDNHANVNFAVCHQRGWKGVAAKRWWHGIFGFLSHDQPGGYQDGVCSELTYDFLGRPTDDPDYITTYDFDYYETQSGVDTTKYLTVTFEFEFTQSITDTATIVDSMGSPITNYNPRVYAESGSASLSMSMTVNPQSGERILNSWALSNTLQSTLSLDGVVINTIDPAHDRDFTPGTYNLQLGFSLGADPFNYFTIPANGNVSIATLFGRVEVVNQALQMLSYDTFGNPKKVYGSAFDVDMPDDIAWTRRSVSLSNTEFVFGYTEQHNSTYDVDNTGSGGNHYHEEVAGEYNIDCTITLDDANNAGTVYDDLKSLLGHWHLDDDAIYPWRTDGVTTVVPKMSRLEVGSNVPPELLVEGTVNDLENPIADEQGRSPFTTADSGSVPDGWSVNSSNKDNSGNSPGDPGYDIMATQWTATYDQRTWFDDAVYQWQFPAGKNAGNSAATDLVKFFDGSVQGAPNPAGYQNYFRFDFGEWQGCCESDLVVYLNGQGMFLDDYNGATGAQIPRNATDWTNNLDVLNHPVSGPFLSYAGGGVGIKGAPSCTNNFQVDGALWGRKWAECGETYQSYNFARPCGADKFLIDEETVYCCDGTNLANLDGSPATWLTLTGYWGGKCVGGWYDGVATDGSGVLSFGTKIFDAPSDWETASGDGDSAFGKLRFSGAPSLVGRAQITPDGAGTIMTFVSGQPNFGMNASTHQESVDLYDGNMALLAGGVTATRIDDGSFSVGAAYPAAVFVMIDGAPPWYQNDTFPKGDFLYLTWLRDFRTNGQRLDLAGQVDCDGDPVTLPTENNGYASFSQTAAALPLLKCSPRVFCWSPNGEVFANGQTDGFPAFTLDERYASRWQGQVVWSMTDPLWQTPHRPCGKDPMESWGMDDGSCLEPAEDYYALPPMFEARMSVPSGFPSLPTGITIGFLSPVDHTSGAVAYPPDVETYADDLTPSGTVTPWGLAMTLCDHTGCYNYAAWVIGCPPG